MQKELTEDQLLEVHGGGAWGDLGRGLANVAIGALSGGWAGVGQAAIGSTDAIDAVYRIVGGLVHDPSADPNDGADGHGGNDDGAGGTGGYLTGGFDNPTGDPASPDYGHSDGSPSIEPS